MLPFLHEIEEWMKSLRSNSGFRLKPWPLFIAGAVLLAMSYIFMPAVVVRALSLSLFIAPLWLPFLLVGGAWSLWVILKRSEFIAKQNYILLELKPPREIIKTPLAMEAMLSGLHLAPGESNWYKKYIQGGVRPWWSLEIASIEGRVHFFIWTRANFRKIVESQVYAQYPGAQVLEAPDYTRTISAEPHEWNIWGATYVHTSEDAVPIKTYVEYGLDKVQKEIEQTDPLASLIEFMGSIGKGENLWLQFVIRVHKGEKYHKTKPDGKAYTWKDQAKELIEKIRSETRDTYIDHTTGEERPGFPNPTKGQSEKIAAIERNVSKLAFDVGCRALYLATPEKFDAINITALNGIFKQFSSEGWNGMKWTGGMTIFDDYPWEIGVEKLKNLVREDLVDAYRRRQFFYEPFIEDHMVMSTEELATVFHIPSKAVETPSLERIPSATSTAPANLPT